MASFDGRKERNSSGDAHPLDVGVERRSCCSASPISRHSAALRPPESATSVTAAGVVFGVVGVGVGDGVDGLATVITCSNPEEKVAFREKIENEKKLTKKYKKKIMKEKGQKWCGIIFSS